MNTEIIIMDEREGSVWKNIRVYREERDGEVVVFGQLLNPVPSYIQEETFTYPNGTSLSDIIQFLTTRDSEMEMALTDQDDAG